MKIKLTKKESHFVTREILNEYVGQVSRFNSCLKLTAHSNQSDDLPVTFLCKDGVMKASGRLLMLSDYWCHMIGGALKFNNPIEFKFDGTKNSKCFPKQVLKSYLDHVHLAAPDEIDLLDLLLLLELLNCDGRQNSEFEQKMAIQICNDLMQMDYGMETKLMILQFMKCFDSSIQGSDDKTKQLTTIEQYSSFVLKDTSFDLLTQGTLSPSLSPRSDQSRILTRRIKPFEILFLLL